MEKNNAIDALELLGLTRYEAKVFVALQKLGTGSASEINRIADVPRSQVYGAAKKLEKRRLLEVQQSNPIQYRPVSLDEARERLQKRYARREDQAFGYLERVQARQRNIDEQQQDVWTLRGQDAVTIRMMQLVRDAEERVLYGGGPSAFDDTLVADFAERGSNGVTVTVISAADEVIELFEDESGVTVCPFPTAYVPEDRQTGRVLVVDDETVLLSVFSNEGMPDLQTETAIWSEKTGFAAIIGQLLHTWFEEHLDC